MTVPNTNVCSAVQGWITGPTHSPRPMNGPEGRGSGWSPHISQAPPLWKNRYFRLLREAPYSDTLYDSTSFLPGKIMRGNYMVHIWCAKSCILCSHALHDRTLKGPVWSTLFSSQQSRVTLISLVLLSWFSKCFFIKQALLGWKDFRLWKNTQLGLNSISDID